MENVITKIKIGVFGLSKLGEATLNIINNSLQKEYLYKILYFDKILNDSDFNTTSEIYSNIDIIAQELEYLHICIVVADFIESKDDTLYILNKLKEKNIVTILLGKNISRDEINEFSLCHTKLIDNAEELAATIILSIATLYNTSNDNQLDYQDLNYFFNTNKQLYFGMGYSSDIYSVINNIINHPLYFTESDRIKNILIYITSNKLNTDDILLINESVIPKGLEKIKIKNITTNNITFKNNILVVVFAV